MIEVKKLTCIVCPVGCKIEVMLDNNRIIEIKGNMCLRGAEYAKSEVLNPVRPFFAVIKVKNGELPVVSVKSNKPIPKECIRKMIKELSRVKLKAPIKAGEVVVKRLECLDVDLIATRTIEERSSHLSSKP